MVNKDQIIKLLYNNYNFNQALKKICSDVKYQDDLKMEFFLILMEKDDIVVQNMFNNRYLLKWSVSVLKNQYHSKTSPFYKKYRSTNKQDEYVDRNIDGIEDDMSNDIDITTEVESILDNDIHWFDAHIFRLYYFQTTNRETGEIRKPLSTRKIEELHKFNNLKIDHTSVHKSIKRTLSRVRTILKQKGILEKWKQ